MPNNLGGLSRTRFFSLDRPMPVRRVAYRGVALPAGWRAYSESSPWRRPIDATAPVDPNSDAMITTLAAALTSLSKPLYLQLAATSFSSSIHIIDSELCPRVSIPSSSLLPQWLDADQDQTAEAVPVPDEVFADPGGDKHIVFVDLATNQVTEAWNWTRLGAGSYTLGMAGRWDLGGTGYNDPDSLHWKRNGATASKCSYIGGLVRHEEFAAGAIEHALGMVLPGVRATEFCAPPASATDGTQAGSNFIPEGIRMQLDPKLDLTALGLTTATRILARALQVYGAFVIDKSTGWNIKLQIYPAPTPWAQYTTNFDAIPITAYRFLQGNVRT